jgi:hypothetical protein
MRKYFNNVTNRTGDVVPGARVTVTLSATGAMASIYSDDGVTAKANPMTADGNGYFEFYVADGRYTLTITGSGIQTLTISDLLIEDLEDLEDDTGAARVGYLPAGTGAVARTVQAKLRAVQVSVEDHGAVAGLGVTDAQAAANVVAFQAAMDYVASVGGGIVKAEGQYYVLSGKLRRPGGVYLEGNGVGEWEPLFPSRPKTWEGTSLIFKGTGTRDVTFDGITSAKHGGGWREDPDNPGQFFKLTSFYNADAAGTTPATRRAFSVAVAPKDGAMYGGLRNLRIVNWNAGIAGWSDTASTSLGDEWDIGYLLKNNEYADDYNIQVVGGWREFAHLNCVTITAESRSERNRVVRAKFQGRIGLGIRAPDRWDVDATTANTVQIYFSEESYWASTGTFRGSDGATYTYTGTSQAGTAFTFTGVTPDPSAITHVRSASTGFGNCSYEDVYAYGIDHQSGSSAAALGLSNSRPLEASGYPLRGVKFRNLKLHTGEPVLLHLHDAQDMVFIDPQFEGGAHLIASPVSTDATYAAAPVGDTRNLVMLADHGTDEQDTRLFLPRNGFVEALQLSPRSDLSGDAVLKAFRNGKHTVLQSAGSSSSIYLRRSSGTNAVRVTDTGNMLIEGGGQFSLTGGTALINADAAANIQIRNGTTARFQVFGASGNVAPGADNTQTLGTSALRWSTVYGTNLRPGDGTVIWTAGSGTPEGAVAAPVGSLFTRTDGGASTTLYVKQSGTGNTGWVAK